MNKFRNFLFLLLFFAAGIFSVQAQTDIPGMDVIDGKAMLKTVQTLTAPEMEGRQPGSPGYERAVKFVVESFESLGLQQAGEDGFVQHVPAEYVAITETPELFILDGQSDPKAYSIGSDFVCRGLTGFGNVTAPVVFCGYGISEPTAGYDDYAGIDVKGKIVLVFKQNPDWKLAGLDLENKFNRYRANVAAAHGAVALLMVSTPLAKDPQKPIGSLMDGDGHYDINMPQIHVSIDVAEDFLKGSGINLKSLQAQIDSLKRPHSLALHSRAHIIIQGEYVAEKTSDNVVALLPGSDPELSKQYIVISAHLDHVGMQGAGLIFPGANDNASGSAAVLQLARAFVKSAVEPRRSVLFVLYTGEEQGLVGSDYFAQHLPFPPEQITAAFNLDCIAYGDSIQVGGGKSNLVLWNIARTQDSLNARRMIKSTWGGGGADLTALFNKGVPGLYFASRYSYTHLHLPSDTPETLNPELYQEMVRLVYRVTRIVSDGEYEREKVK